MPLRFVNPNFHVILVHYPLGVFVLGVVIELLGFLWSRSGVRTAARWMIALGALLSIPAATSGIFALYDVKKNQGFTSESYQMLRMHVIFMGAASILAVFCAVIGVGASDVWRKRLHFPLLLGVVAAWGLMVAGAWNAGESIYQHGTSVSIIKVKEKESEDGIKAKVETLYHPKVRENPSLKNYDDAVNYYMGGSLQHHIIVSGFAFAAALGALALAIRRTHSNSLGHEVIVDRTVPARQRRSGTNDLSVIQSFNPDAELGALDQPKIPSGRFWLLAVLMIISTAGLGYWVATGQKAIDPAGWGEFISKMKPDDPAVKYNRVAAHAILGGAFLVLALICALLAAAAPRKSLLLGFFSMLLIAVIGAQVWMGVLLTFQKASPDGPLTHFQTDEEAKLQQERIDAAEKAKPPAAVPTTEPAATEPATTEPATTAPATAVPAGT